MRYALLIYSNEADEASASPEEQAAMYADYNTFGEQFKDVIKDGEALLATSSATTVRVRDGKTLTTDGPFAETKEQLGGFYLVTCQDLDEAIKVASGIPGAKHGSIEVRPIMEFE